MSADATPERPREETRLRRLGHEIGGRLLFFAGVAALSIGSIVLLVTLLREPRATGPLPPAPTFEQKQRKVAEVDAGARKVAGRFILTAVARKNELSSWDLVHPTLRAGFTKREWARGEMPISPFPVASVDEARFRVDHLSRNTVTLDVALIPKAGTGVKAEVFKIGLVAVGSGEGRRWLVDYWMPVWGARVPTVR